jgi:hypothetical protein
MSFLPSVFFSPPPPSFFSPKTALCRLYVFLSLSLRNFLTLFPSLHPALFYFTFSLFYSLSPTPLSLPPFLLFLSFPRFLLLCYSYSFSLSLLLLSLYLLFFSFSLSLAFSYSVTPTLSLFLSYSFSLSHSSPHHLFEVRTHAEMAEAINRVSGEGEGERKKKSPLFYKRSRRKIATFKFTSSSTSPFSSFSFYDHLSYIEWLKPPHSISNHSISATNEWNISPLHHSYYVLRVL